jgi:hypothetical protein
MFGRRLDVREPVRLPPHSPAADYSQQVTVFATIVAAYASIFATAWMDFARSMESAWLATVGVIVGVVVLGIHLALRHTNHGPLLPGKRDLDEFLHLEIDTATGWLARTSKAFEP